MALRAPRALQAGSRVVAIAPSSPFDATAFEQGLAYLRERYRVDHRADVLARDGYLAGDDQRRLDELQAALDDASVEAIIAARGGYGATRLLDRLDLRPLLAHPKVLVGFSDITALHALWARVGLRSIHGPMVATLGKGDAAGVHPLCALLEGHVPQALEGLACVNAGTTRGVLLGGNLTVLTALIGTPHMPSFDGAVLFIEDVTERPYRIDRMLTTWQQSGALRGVRGLAFGAFTACEPGLDGVTVERVLQDFARTLKVPTVMNVPAGHVDDNRPLPLGALVELDGSRGVLKFLGGACQAQ